VIAIATRSGTPLPHEVSHGGTTEVVRNTSYYPSLSASGMPHWVIVYDALSGSVKDIGALRIAFKVLPPLLF